MPKLKARTIIPTEEEDAVLTAAALSDPDNPPWTDEDFARAEPPRRGLGRPKADTVKKPVSLRLDEEVVRYFKSEGSGWQTKMNEVLADYVRSQR